MAKPVNLDDLPSLDALPDLPQDHPVLHRIINSYVGGDGKKAIAAKLGISLAYVKGVIYTYLEQYDTRR